MQLILYQQYRTCEKRGFLSWRNHSHIYCKWWSNRRRTKTDLTVGDSHVAFRFEAWAFSIQLPLLALLFYYSGSENIIEQNFTNFGWNVAYVCNIAQNAKE